MKKSIILNCITIVLTFMVFTSDVLLFWNEENKYKGIVLQEISSGYWDGQDKDGNPVGGKFGTCKVVYLDNNYMPRLNIASVSGSDFKEGSLVTCKVDNQGTNLLAYLLLFILLVHNCLLIVNVIKVHGRLKESA